MTGGNASARRRWRIALPIAATVALLAPLAYLWQASLVPKHYSVMQMGYADFGVSQSGPSSHSGGHGGVDTVSVETLVADPARKADRVFDLVAAETELTIGDRPVPGYTLNGTSPGPTLTVTQDQLVEVRLRNESVTEGMTLHWHGLDVPNAMDGVAGVTQDAVPEGGEFVYRFVAEQVGTYWYHSHQVSHEQVIGGLYGILVVEPRDPGAARDVIAAAHTYLGAKTINGVPGDYRVPARPGEEIRLRVVNTDNGPIKAWSDTPYRLLAVDGTDVNQPGEVVDQSVTMTGGARVDLGLVMPADGRPVRVQVSKGTAVILGEGDPALPPEPLRELDLLAYGAPLDLGFDPDRPDRSFDYSIGYRPGFVKGKPGLWWSINGHLYPNVPMYVVRQGEVIRMHIDNHSGEVHPMHLHGHHALVLARNGVPATGSPWWVDSLNVQDDETYDIAFVADNPGIWMDHCHNLGHAKDGMIAHLMYEGVTTPYLIGRSADNRPE